MIRKSIHKSHFTWPVGRRLQAGPGLHISRVSSTNILHRVAVPFSTVKRTAVSQDPKFGEQALRIVNCEPAFLAGRAAP